MKTMVTFFALLVLVASIAVPATLAFAHDDEEDREEHGDGRERREGRERGGEGREGDRERPRLRTADPAARAAYAKECGACHLDFPPVLLPPSAHRRIMAGLERHFGQNAELDPDVRIQLEGWLVANAGPEVKLTGGAAAEPRISTLPWFAKEHRKASAATGPGRSVKSFAACAACHPGAKDWDFAEDRVKVPR
jgi:cytochrome c553